MKVIKSSNFIESPGGGGSGGGLTSSQVQALIDNAGHADETVVTSLQGDVTNNTDQVAQLTTGLTATVSQLTANTNAVQALELKDRHVNVATNGLVAYDPIRSFVTTQSSAFRWFKIADLRINGTFRGFAVNYLLMARYIQSQGVIRVASTNSPSSIQFLRAKVGVGNAQIVLMREDANPENYHLLLKVGSFNRHVVMSQEVFRTRVDTALVWNVGYQETASTADNTTTQTVTDYTGFTQVASLVL